MMRVDLPAPLAPAAPGPAEATPNLYVGINVLTSKNLAALRSTGHIPQPSSAPATQAAAP